MEFVTEDDARELREYCDAPNFPEWVDGVIAHLVDRAVSTQKRPKPARVNEQIRSFGKKLEWAVDKLSPDAREHLVEECSRYLRPGADGDVFDVLHKAVQVEYQRDPYRSDMAEGVEVYLHVTPDGLAYSGPGTGGPVDDWFRKRDTAADPVRSALVFYTMILMSEPMGGLDEGFEFPRNWKTSEDGDSKTVAVVRMIQVHVERAYQELTGKTPKKMDAPHKLVQDAMK